ncbi:gamma-glutamyltransferase [Actinomycetota bacterium]
MSTRVAVAATGPEAVEAGLRVGREGGNAVDAAIAAVMTSMGTEPGIVSHMSGAFITVLPPDGPPEVIDGNTEMPGRGLPKERFGAGVREITTPYGGGVTLYAGYGSVATPGTFAGLEVAQQRHGRAEWAQVVQPAADVLRAGFRIGGASALYLSVTKDNLFGWDPHARRLTRRPDGSALEQGDRFVNPELAETLETIGRQGASAIYSGEIGDALAAVMEQEGGLITQADLAAYQPEVRTPLPVRVGDWVMHTNPPPSVGGPMLAVMMGELAAREGRTWRDVIEIQRHVLAYRHHVHDKSTDLEEDGYALLAAVERHGLKGLPTSSSTIHVSTVDEQGRACAITASSGYSSGATVPGTGLMLNNALGEPELNRLGLHALLPGTRLASNMAPTVGRSSDGSVLAIGSPGADRITTALMQVLARYALMGQGLQESIDKPRLHVRLMDDSSVRLEHEDDPEMLAAAAESGLPTVVHPGPSMFFGGVGAALLSPGGELSAAADPRREAATGVS